MRANTPETTKRCAGPCQRPLDETTDGLTEFLNAEDVVTSEDGEFCTDCVPTPKSAEVVIPQIVTCMGCERPLALPAEPTLEEAFASPAEAPVVSNRHPEVCQDCIDDGFVPPKPRRRRDIVIENCEFYLANGIGLTEAAEREGYSDRSHLDSVLRRWRRLELTHALGALDPAQVRERP